MARAGGARFESHQHVDIARENGVPIEGMRPIDEGGSSPFPDEEFVLLQYAEAVATGEVTDRIHAALCAVYDPAEVVAVGLLVVFYDGLCTSVAADDLPFEGGTFVGWTPADETVADLFG